MQPRHCKVAMTKQTWVLLAGLTLAACSPEEDQTVNDQAQPGVQPPGEQGKEAGHHAHSGSSEGWAAPIGRRDDQIHQPHSAARQVDEDDSDDDDDEDEE